MMKKLMGDSMRDRVRHRAETHRYTGGLDTLALPEGVDFYKPEKGTEEFDIIPYRVSADNHPEVKIGELWYERTYLSHRNVGPEDKFLVCPRTINKRCPICEEYQKLKRDPDADEDVVAGLKPKERELFNIVLKEGKGEIKILDISVHLFGRKLEAEILEGDESNSSFAELEGGKTIKVRWEQKTMGTNKFLEAGRIDFEDRDDIDEEALEAVVDLDKAMKIMSYEEIEKIFQEGSDEGNETKDKDNNGTDNKRDEPEKKSTRRVIGRGKSDKKEETTSTDKDENKDDNVCMACEGSGENTKGKTCKVCGGSGKDHEDENDDGNDKDKEEKETKSIRRAIRRR